MVKPVVSSSAQPYNPVRGNFLFFLYSQGGPLRFFPYFVDHTRLSRIYKEQILGRQQDTISVVKLKITEGNWCLE